MPVEHLYLTCYTIDMLVIDIEASGVIPHLHSVVSIGALDTDTPDRRLYLECQVWSGAEIMEEALAVNGFTEAGIKDTTKLTEAEAVQQFLEWSQHSTNRTITGQNPSFDRDMLRAAAYRAGLAWDLAYRTLDTHTLCYMHMVKRNLAEPIDKQHRRSALNLDTILQYCGIPEEPQPHNALTGALCHAEVTSRLLYNKPLLEEFSAYPLPW